MNPAPMNKSINMTDVIWYAGLGIGGRKRFKAQAPYRKRAKVPR